MDLCTHRAHSHLGTRRVREQEAPRMACAWHVHGMCMACAWHVHGMCMACAWRVHGTCMACARHAHGMCTTRTDGRQATHPVHTVAVCVRRREQGRDEGRVGRHRISAAVRPLRAARMQLRNSTRLGT